MGRAVHLKKCKLLFFLACQVSPVVLGARHLPDPLQGGAQPLLFVGNHTRFGLYDLPLLVRAGLS